MYGKRRARIPIIGFCNTIPFFLRTLVVKCGQRGAAVERIGRDRRHRLMNDDPRDIRAFLKICAADRCDRGGNADDPLDRLRNEHDTRKIAVADDSARIFIMRVFRRDFHAFKRGAARKAGATKAAEIFAERYLFQIGAIGKGFAAERFKRRGENNAF